MSGAHHRQANLEAWLDAIGGTALDVPLQPQPDFRLPGYFPQLINGLEIPSVLHHVGDVGVGIAKVLTPKGRISRRALPQRFGPRDLRTQWRIPRPEATRLICIGNHQDGPLERLWAAQSEVNIWGRIQSLGFDACTSLNFSIYLDAPRLEHLVNIKRTWLTVAQMQRTSTLVPIPHLQWATRPDLERQLRYAQGQGFHTLTLNLQMIRRQGWDTVAEGLDLIQEEAADLRLLFAGVSSLKRMGKLALRFPDASFTNVNVHYLAQRRILLDRDGTRVIKVPADGHPDLILALNVTFYQDFLAECRRDGGQGE